MFEIVIPGLPPSVNHTYGLGRHGMFKNKKARDWEIKATGLIKKAAIKLWGSADLSGRRGAPVELVMHFCKPSWRGKTKKTCERYVRPDVSNFIKITEDAVFKTLGLDDCAVTHLSAVKCEIPGEVRTIVRMEFL